ncbi:MAG: hypothetical protein ACREF4_00575 [Gammaproteobacteria bacterium]
MPKSMVLGLAGLLLLGGCAVGVKHDYNQRGLDLGIATSATVAVGTLDQRPYIVNGQKAPDFVGLSRGGFGNPFDVTTQSGRPLASDVSSAIAESMRAKGVDAKPVEIKHALGDDQARAAMRAAGTQKSVLLTLFEWKGDSMINVGFNYDFTLRVFDKDGKQLASKLQQGRENLGAADPFSPGGTAQIVPRFRRMMEALFQDPDVVKALQP